MKTYPEIPGPSKAPKQPCYVFVKYDGSNCRAEWSPKRGWYKFGTRKCMIDETDVIFGRSCLLFKEKYGDDLEKVFKSEKHFHNVQNVVAFFEFFGTKSFSGMHFPEEQQWDVVLFDVNVHKKGFLAPKEFLGHFGHLKIAELVCQCNMGEQLIEQVRKETIDLTSKYPIQTEIPEGVVCKGGSKHKLWMTKIKTERYKAELRKRYEVDWEKYWEGQ